MDLLVVNVASSLIYWPASNLDGWSDDYRTALAVSGAIWLAYFGLMEGLLGYTLGKRLLGLRVNGRGMALFLKALAVACTMEMATAITTLAIRLTSHASWEQLLVDDPVLFWMASFSYPAGWILTAWACWPRDGSSLLDEAFGVRVA